MPKGNPKPCSHNPHRRCGECRKEKNRIRTAAKYHEDIETSRAKLRERYAQNPEKARQKTRDWRKKHPEKVREQESRLGMRFGQKKLDKMFVDQKGLCPICKQALPPPEDRHTDHDHSRPGEPNVRTLLCNKCNPGLGCFNDDPELLREAADYIERHRVPLGQLSFAFML